MLRNQSSVLGRHIGKVTTVVKGVLSKREFASLFICCISMKSTLKYCYHSIKKIFQCSKVGKTSQCLDYLVKNYSQFCSTVYQVRSPRPAMKRPARQGRFSLLVFLPCRGSPDPSTCYYNVILSNTFILAFLFKYKLSSTSCEGSVIALLQSSEK